ncbi:MAG: class I tRNA ligase family protein [Patescibacteria group bacterium]|nr:class I tRNA ligase family protein [Patescibacteria group bacterium]
MFKMVFMLINLKSFNPSEVEEKVLQFWKEKNIFQKTLNPKGKKKKFFHFWEGPPYANGRPGIHHVLARVFKDVFLRYKTMQGFIVPRKAGWDTHGLPIEIEAEKDFGVSSKVEIEKIGIDRFNQKAKEIVFRCKDEFEKMTERIGYWLDLKNAYVTYSPDFIESLWWVFKRIYERGYLKELYRVVPYCPRCQTPLSNHELGQPGVYKSVPDPSLFVKFPLAGKENEFLLVWTTTPWTLPANVAVAVLPEGDYVKYKVGQDYLWMLEGAPFLREKFELEEVERKKGKEMAGWKYQPLYPLKQKINLPIEPYSVLLADFVSMEEGTGLVHIAPTFGEDDFNLVFAQGIKENHHLPHTVEDDGTMAKGVIGEGLPIKEADKVILQDLEKRGLVLLVDKIEHEYPHCWRCSSPLIYFAKKSWFFEVSRLRKELVEANQKINWYPEYLKEGRFGNWIAEAKDWSISRDRFWGTPLPIWRCQKCQKLTVVGSFQELFSLQPHEEPNKYFLLRHGEAESNIKQIVDADPKNKDRIGLTSKGKKQAQQVAKKLKKEGVDLIFSSDFRRTRETAEIIAKELGIKKVIFDERLREINVGIFHGHNVQDYHTYFPSYQDKFQKQPEKGESLKDVSKRVWNFVKEVEKKYHGKKILIVSHEYPLWMLYSVIKGLWQERSIREKEERGNDFLKPAQFEVVDFALAPRDEWGMADYHRPYVDKISLKCQHCGSLANRISDVADVWFDSGAMPYAQHHWPFEGPKTKYPFGFPADFICEGIDQTRGWFYTLLATAVLLGMGTPYKNVVSLGLVLDKYGQKMSKSRGNVVDPWSVINKFGIDAVRWYFYSINSPAEPKNFDEEEIKNSLRRLLMLVYNSFAFLQLYGQRRLPLEKTPSLKNPLDQWILLRLSQTALAVEERMDNYDVLKSTQLIEELVDDLSRWYIRRSRRRFQKPDLDSLQGKKDYQNASWVLAFVLLNLSKLLAPFIPFFAEALYQSLKKLYRFKSQDSVHLEEWPSFSRPSRKEAKLLEEMSKIRNLASLVLAKRIEVKIKVKQPLSVLRIKNPDLWVDNPGLLKILAEEVNVKEVVFDKEINQDFELDTTITPELKTEGILRELSRNIQDLRQEAGCLPKDKINLWFEGDKNLLSLVENNLSWIKEEVSAKNIRFERSAKVTAQMETKIDNQRIWIGLEVV